MTLDGVFVFGGYLNEHVAAASGQPVRAAGEALLEEQKDGSWAIVMLNNRSYDYMPAAESWAAGAAALAPTGIPYPRTGWSEVYPREGSYADTRAAFGLAAQLTVRCIAKVADAYKLERKTQRSFASLVMRM